MGKNVTGGRETVPTAVNLDLQECAVKKVGLSSIDIHYTVYTVLYSLRLYLVFFIYFGDY